MIFDIFVSEKAKSIFFFLVAWRTNSNILEQQILKMEAAILSEILMSVKKFTELGISEDTKYHLPSSVIAQEEPIYQVHLN